MRTLLLTSTILGALAATIPAHAADLAPYAAAPSPLLGTSVPPVVVQIGPTTAYSTLNCANFAKLPDGDWKALAPAPFGLGFVQGIVLPPLPIKLGQFIYNNIDLYSQLELQCASGALVTARY